MSDIGNDIPLADDDPQVIIQEEDSAKICDDCNSSESLHSSFTTTSSSPNHTEFESNPDELEEKARLITQVLELQNTLDDLSQRVDSVKGENLKLESENLVLGQYIENLMSASSVFQSTAAKSTKK